jgi:transcriptional regulator with AAA-type ATPase domain/Tfp pilus assembly protein PilF
VAEQLARLEPSRESYLRLGIIVRESGEFGRSLRILRDALRFKDGPAYLVPEIHIHLAAAWDHLEDYKRMAESLRRAYAARPKPRSDSNLHLSFGNFHLGQRRYREAYEEFLLAERTARSPLQRGKAIGNQAVALYYQRRLSDAFSRLNSALRIHERNGHRETLVSTRFKAACFHFDEEQYQRTLSTSLRCAREFEGLGNRSERIKALFVAGYAAGELGRWEDSRRHLDACIRAAQGDARTHWRAVALASRARAQASLDDFAAASRDLAEAQRLLRGHRDWIGSMHLYRTRAHLAELFGNWTEARRWCLRAERLAIRKDDPVRVAQFRKRRAKAEAELGRRRAATHARKGAALLETFLGAGRGAGDSSASLAGRLAASCVPVLIEGESGVGKSELARTLHAAGPRAGKPLVVVPCEQLVFAASDVAGHEAGAWSGASRESLGYARQAAGGTLVLDRVDELSPEAQRSLVPIVEGRVRAVGSAFEDRVDARIVAVVRKPERLIPELRSRLEGAVLRVRPLRERAAEIPTLVRSLLGDRFPITTDALALLARRRWEGNLPELRAAVERLVAAGAGPIGVKRVREALRTPDRRRVAARRETLRRMAEALK